jgi:hypothetical protein
VTAVRYLVVRRPSTDLVDYGYEVVDTDTTGDSPGEVVCPATSMANAGTVAAALNGQPLADLATAKRALVTVHGFIAEQLEADPHPDWGSYYGSVDEIEFVNQVQHDHEEPF